MLKIKEWLEAREKKIPRCFFCQTKENVYLINAAVGVYKDEMYGCEKCMKEVTLGDVLKKMESHQNN